MNNVGMGILGAVVVFVTIIISMTLHEIMHGVAAYMLGDTTAKDDGRLSLNLVRHLDPIYSIIVPLVLYVFKMPIFGGAKPVPVNSENLKFGREWGMVIVALFGPLTNLILAYIGFLGWFFIGNEIVNMISYYFMSVNLGFCCFNILPIPPLDGSRLLHAIAPDGIREAIDRLEQSMGRALVYVLILVFGGFISSIIVGMMNGILAVFLWTVGG